MKRKTLFVVFMLIVLCIFSSFVVAAKRVKVPACPINSDINIVFYGQTGFGGVGTLSRSWMIHFLDWWETHDSSINYAELDANDVKSDCDLSSFSNLKLYIQPGGDAYNQQNMLGTEGKNNILSYINNGGGFFGTCAGFYFTAVDYYWQGSYYNWQDMLDYYPATVEGSITDIADYEGNPDHKLTPLSTGFNAIYYGGPTIGWKDTTGPAPGITEATYTEITGDLPAIIKYNNALLTSVHLEAYENDGITGLTTEDRIENYKYLGNLINEVAGTNFYVPPYTNPQCNDNLDNDGDNLTDYPNDPGCSSANDGNELGSNECDDGQDNDGDGYTDTADTGCASVTGTDETNCGDNICEGSETWQTCLADCPIPQCSDGIDNDADNLTDYPADPGCISSEDDNEVDGPVEILFDGFEDGNLNGWALYGPGTIWSASTDTAYEGSYSARAKQTGAGDDSFMETTIDASGYSTVTFEYYRKLVGLDTADDFEVSYYINGWTSVEHLGTGNANDGSFVFKSFSIPSTATKIRFKCEVGAVSEKCYVDNVKVLAE